MRVLHSAALAAGLLLLTSAASAQSLGEAAAKEKQRKKGQTAPAKVYTEDDLRSAGRGGTYSAPSSAAAPEAAPADSAKEPAKGEESGEGKEQEKTEDELRAEQETAWRQKLDDATKEVAHYQDQLRQIQLDLNDISGGVFTPRRAALQTRLEETQKLLASAQEKLVALQEEGRRNRFR